ncbi:MAG: T9SS type A sorting domain-containing protein [Dysgonamonadaceae bacterium]|jgi:hypothetical protein|nr:T9SS type A sorting domain-containing protein [Dysgonamonadaceae bacterium]
MKTKFLQLLVILFLCQANTAQERKWTLIDSLKDYYLYKIFAHNPDTVFIVGANGYGGNKKGMIAKSVDGAISWNITVMDDVSVLFTDIVFCDENTGFVCGENGMLLKTTDEGETWEQKTTNTSRNINAVAYSDINSLWAVGNGGLILHSTDEGENWQTIEWNITENLNDIAFKNDIGYITGSNGLLYETQDKGANWTKKEIEEPYSLTDICIADENAHILGEYGIGIYSGDDDWNFIPFFRLGTEHFSCLFLKNDTLYGVFSIPTDGYTQIFRIYANSINWHLDNSGWKEYVLDQSTIYVDDRGHADIYFPNDSIGYAVSGSVLFKASPADTTVLIENITHKPVSIRETDDRLIIQLENLPIRKLEIVNISGTRVLNRQEKYPADESVLNITTLQKGIYLINITSENHDIYTIKWIKR